MPGLSLMRRLAGWHARRAARWRSRRAARWRSRRAAGGRPWCADRRGAVAVIFAFSVMPLAMAIGLASDYSFYVKVQSQLNLAADTAAMQAVRVASEVSRLNGDGSVKSPADYQTAVQTAGQQAGQQWFQAQMGNLVNGVVPIGNIAVNVAYTASPSRFTSSVSYTGTVPTNFGGLFHVASFNVSGASSAVISNAYVEVLMLLDNSSSMLIGATTTDIVALQNATPCSTQSANEGQPMDGDYSWIYPGNYGYRVDGSETAPPNALTGNCDPQYTGPNGTCPYPPTLPNVSQNTSNSNTWICTNGGGTPTPFYYSSTYLGDQNRPGTQYLGTAGVANAPCAFACHDRSDNKDYYGLARSLNPPVTLRLDTVQQAAANVVSTLQGREQETNQFTVGIYQFNSQLQPLYPAASSGQEAGTDLATALSMAQNVKNTPNLSPNSGNTNFPGSANTLAGQVGAAGDGTMPTGPLKNLFIVTDGMENWNGTMGPMTSASSEQICAQFWAKGFSVYVLYTPYLPLPNPYYLYNNKGYAEPTSSSPDVAALKACARYPQNFFQASDPTAINTAMQAMLAAALNSPGRVSN